MIQTLTEGFRSLPIADRVKLLVLLALLGAHAVFSLFFAQAAPYTADEIIYHFMARDLVRHGTVTVWNGYEEFQSAALALPFLLVQKDLTLAPQYPGLYAFLAAPFYWALELRGLILLNALAFVGSLGVVFLIARRLFHDLALALNACLILWLATFAWQYSQAIWPHTLSMFIDSLALYCAIVAWQAPARRQELAAAFLGGLALSIGIGVRLDAIFVLPAILFPFLFVSPVRWLAILAACLGLAPGLLALAAINQAKFGIFSPFTYGYAHGAGLTSGVAPYLPLAAAGLAVAVGAWLASRPAGRRWLARYRWGAAAGVGILAAILLLTPQGWAMISKLADGLRQLLVDMRFRDLDIKEGGLGRSLDGAMVYLDHLKKSLLQSAPYLVALIVPLAAMLRRRDTMALAILFLVPGAFIGVYAYFQWHGGRSLNLRYFVPVLPYLAILTAYAWRSFAPGFTRPWAALATVAGIALAVFHVANVYPAPPGLPEQELVYLTAPLVLAAVTALLVVAAVVIPRQRAPHLRGMACAAMLIGMVWGGAVGFAYDFRHVYSIRKGRAMLSRDVAPLIKPDSILFTPPVETFYSLLDLPRLRVAMPWLDNFATFRPLVDFHLAAGRDVYIWVSRFNIGILQGRNLLSGLQTQQLYRGYGGMLVRVTAPPDQG